jgi:hypothetical protein
MAGQLRERLEMQNRSVRIALPQLPMRSRSLSPSELSQVFGGCAKQYEDCDGCACCEGLLCNWGTCATQLTDPK